MRFSIADTNRVVLTTLSLQGLSRPSRKELSSAPIRGSGIHVMGNQGGASECVYTFGLLAGTPAVTASDKPLITLSLQIGNSIRKATRSGPYDFRRYSTLKRRTISLCFTRAKHTTADATMRELVAPTEWLEKVWNVNVDFAIEECIDMPRINAVRFKTLPVQCLMLVARQSSRTIVDRTALTTLWTTPRSRHCS